MSRTRLDILVVAPNSDSSFVEADVAGLRGRYTVERLAYRDFANKPAFLRALARQLREQRPALVLFWFLTPAYSLESTTLARLFGARVALVVGGLEVDYVPELGLGGLRWPHNRLRQKIGLKLPDLVLTPTAFLARRTEELSRPRRLEVIELGIDADHFSPDGRPKDRLVVTVCFEITRETAPLKGLPALLAAAERIPDAEFAIVGRSGGDNELSRLEAAAPPNVRFTGRVSDADLLELYRRAKVYVQVSAHEAFGVAVVESMACGCLPVLSDRGSLPEVAGSVGSYVPYAAPEATAAAISAALDRPDADGANGRNRVLAEFTFDRRIERLAVRLAPLVRGSRS